MKTASTTRARSARRATPAAESSASAEALPSSKPEAGQAIDAVQRYEMIARAAYYRAERRSFAAGSELQDWLEAEAEIDRVLLESTGGTARAFEDRLEAQLREWDARFDALMEAAKKATSEARLEIEEQVEALRGRRATAQEKLQHLRQRTGDAWEDLKEGAEKAWDDMRKALDHLSSRFK